MQQRSTSVTTQTPTFDRSINYDHGDYKMTLDGRLIGYARTYHEAEVTLDQVIFEMLTHGDCATATELDGGQTNALLISSLTQAAIALGLDTSADDDPSDDGEAVNWNSIVAADPPPPEPNPLGDEEGDSTPPDRPRAVTAQSLLIEAKMATCSYCQGIHHIQQCPELRARLFAPDVAPWHDIALGRELCRMKWKNFRAFVALLLSVPAAHLIIYAASYQAFIREYRPDSDMTINQVLTAWANDMRRGGDRGPALERAA
jgi:hypothetical protein